MSTSPAGLPAAGSARRAWTAITIVAPLFAVLAVGSSAVGGFAFLALETHTVGDAVIAVDLSVGFINVLGVLVGVPVIALTLGRLVDRKTAAAGLGRATLAFVGLAAAFGFAAAVLIAVASGEAVAGFVYGALGILLPASIAAGLGRLLIDRVAARRGLAVASTAFAVLMWAAMIGWAVIALYFS